MTTYAATLTRTELGLGTLNIHDGTTYFVRSVDPGRVPIEREEAKSPLVKGSIDIGSVERDAILTGLIQVRGATHAAVRSNISALLSALRQNEYTLTVTIDGTSYAWTCKKAEAGLADGMDFAFRHRLYAHVEFTAKRSPIASAGPL